MARTHRPRAVVEQALIEAAVAIIADQGVRALTSRSVAREAGVNPGLVHRYFGSMNGLYGRVLDALVVRIAAGIGAPFDTSPGSPLDLYVQVLVFAMHDGLDPVELQHEHPVVERLLEIGIDEFGVEGDQARIVAAQLFALFLGWQTFGRFCAHAAGIEPPDPEAQLAWLRQSGRDIAAATRARQDGA